MVWVIGLLLAGGCFTDSGGTGASVSPSEATSTGTSTSTGTPTGSGTSTSTGTSTSSGSSGSSSSSGEPTGTTTMGGEGQACDPWAQNCDDSLKCVPYADDGEGVWNANKCTPVGEGAPGGPCIAMGSATSGYDTCGDRAICWDVNPDTLGGVCYSLCGGSPNTPICAPGSSCFQTNAGVINVCLIECDPLVPKCAADKVCVPDNEHKFLCLPLAPIKAILVGEVCEYLNDCEAGSMCTFAAESINFCDPKLGSRCCTQYCSLKDPLCPPALACRPYPFKGEAPPEHVDLGLCQDPV